MNEPTNQRAGALRFPGTSPVIAPSGRDEILASFLEKQYEDITDLSARSDVVEILRHGPPPPDRYVVRFHCRGFVKSGEGIVEADRFDFGLHFPPDYLHRLEVAEVVTMLWPPQVFHPNVRFPFICIGRVRPGTGIRDLVHQLYEMMTYHRVVMREDDALNSEACAWARQNQHRFPLENRPLRRRDVALRVSQSAADAGPGAVGPIASPVADQPGGASHAVDC